MGILREYRIVMPLSVEEYKIGQLYTVAHLSKCETGGGDGVEVLKNEAFSDYPLFDGQYSEGQYTKKIYIAKKKVGGIVRRILPEKALIGVEEAWNAYPYCRTIIKSEYMGDDFFIRIDSLHYPGRGDLENVHQLPPDKLKEREVVYIDIAAELSNGVDYRDESDPSKYRSSKTNRGPLGPSWIDNTEPCMTCYKLVTAKFKWFGFQTLVESRIAKAETRLFTVFHRQLFCLLDDWYDLSMEDIREIERKTAEDLQDEIKELSVKGLQQGD